MAHEARGDLQLRRSRCHSATLQLPPLHPVTTRSWSLELPIPELPDLHGTPLSWDLSEPTRCFTCAASWRSGLRTWLRNRPSSC